MDEIIFDSSRISYNIKYSPKRKTIAIQVDPVKGLIVLAPPLSITRINRGNFLIMQSMKVTN